MKDKNKKGILLLAVIGAFCLVFLLIALTNIGVNRSPKAEKYDLNCLTELKSNPLKECKE